MQTIQDVTRRMALRMQARVEEEVDEDILVLRIKTGGISSKLKEHLESHTGYLRSYNIETDSYNRAIIFEIRFATADDDGQNK